MSEDTTVDAVEETVDTPEEATEVAEPTIAELKAEAEAKEAEIKELKKVQEAEEVRNNYLRRNAKNDEKLAKLRGELQPTPAQPETNEVFSVRDIHALDKAGIDEGSEKEQIVQTYIKSGLVANAREALEHAGVKGEFEALDAKNLVATTIDENDSEENIALSKREIVDGYKAGNDVRPDDKKAIELIAADNIKDDHF